MPVLPLVVDRRPTLNHVLQQMCVEDLAGPRRAPHLLGQGQRRAAVAIREPNQHRSGCRINRQWLGFHVLGSGEQRLDAFRR